jgi:allantoinase
MTRSRLPEPVPHDLVIRARRAVVPGGEGACCVAVRGGRIVAVEPLTASSRRRLRGARVVELGDDVVLMPGLVDTHVHVNDPGRASWEDFGTATAAAAAGGITTILDMPLNCLPPTVTPEALEVKRAAAAGRCFVDVGFWGGAVPGNGSQLRPLREQGVFGFKCFLADSGVPEFPPLRPAELEEDLRLLRPLDVPMIVHAEDAGILAAAPAPGGRSYGSFLCSRPGAAEDAAVATVTGLARRTGARVHILHLSSADALDLIRGARRDGVRVTAETCPHYLVFSAGEIPDGATQFKCCPPIRDAGNRERLWAGLADGTIGCVVSDHSPCTPELKCLETGDFGTAWGGIASLQVGLSAVWTQARRRGWSVADVARWMSAGPARIAGLRRKGAIEEGRDADFCVFAPDEEWVVDPAKLRHKNPVTPYAGLSLAGVVRATWLRGWLAGDATPHGRLLAAGAPGAEAPGPEPGGGPAGPAGPRARRAPARER